ncbi:electron transport complex subunit RsxG [Motiliproteus sp. SC1-56]|uniref:electron transport complex subunit RsxG n=1 Tax=Motiliproteus sp. SC1-56 TaxID=2799565 RepID=UPI001F5CEEB6|nr:electron transport complex subunit RsxG [Motiliproteus sp. SC1-56]
MIGKGVLKPSYTQRPAFFAGILGMMAALAGTFLAMGFVGTKEAIALRLQEDLQRSLAQVLPLERYDNDPSQQPLLLPLDSGVSLTVYRGFAGAAPRGYAFEVQEPGYSGVIRVLLGLTEAGEILGVRVLSHTETPGLGDKIEAAKDDWILGFNGRSLESLPEAQWAVKKDGGQFDQFSGATITPRAVVRAVKRGLLMHRANQGALAAPLKEQPEDTL